MKSQSKGINFHLRKCIWKRRQEIWWNLVALDASSATKFRQISSAISNYVISSTKVIRNHSKPVKPRRKHVECCWCSGAVNWVLEPLLMQWWNIRFPFTSRTGIPMVNVSYIIQLRRSYDDVFHLKPTKPQLSIVFFISYWSQTWDLACRYPMQPCATTFPYQTCMCC